MSKRFLPNSDTLPVELHPPTLLPQDLKESPLLKSIGVTEKYVINEYMKVVNQDDDLPSKLKALKPLAKEVGIDLDGAQQAGITNNIIVMPHEIVKKYSLASSVIEADPLPPIEVPTVDTSPTITAPKRVKNR